MDRRTARPTGPIHAPYLLPSTTMWQQLPPRQDGNWRRKTAQEVPEEIQPGMKVAHITGSVARTHTIAA